MHTNGVIAEISDTAFYEALGNIRSFNDVIKNIEYGKKKKLTEYDNQVANQLEGIDAHQMFVINKLARGQFGELFLVKDKRENEFVAKTMSKYELEEAEVCEFIID